VQIEHIAKEAMQAGAKSRSCGCGSIQEDLVAKAAESVTGKIWSAKFYAKKPARS
jgi:hypothetical protein